MSDICAARLNSEPGFNTIPCVPGNVSSSAGRDIPSLQVGLKRWASVPRLASGHAVVQRILAAGQQAARHLGHDLNDLPHDITAVASGCAIEGPRV